MRSCYNNYIRMSHSTVVTDADLELSREELLKLVLRQQLQNHVLETRIVLLAKENDSLRNELLSMKQQAAPSPSLPNQMTPINPNVESQNLMRPEVQSRLLSPSPSLDLRRRSSSAKRGDVIRSVAMRAREGKETEISLNTRSSLDIQDPPIPASHVPRSSQQTPPNDGAVQSKRASSPLVTPSERANTRASQESLASVNGAFSNKFNLLIATATVVTSDSSNSLINTASNSSANTASPQGARADRSSRPRQRFMASLSGPDALHSAVQGLFGDSGMASDIVKKLHGLSSLEEETSDDNGGMFLDEPKFRRRSQSVPRRLPTDGSMRTRATTISTRPRHSRVNVEISETLQQQAITANYSEQQIKAAITIQRSFRMMQMQTRFVAAKRRASRKSFAFIQVTADDDMLPHSGTSRSSVDKANSDSGTPDGFENQYKLGSKSANLSELKEEQESRSSNRLASPAVKKVRVSATGFGTFNPRQVADLEAHRRLGIQLFNRNPSKGITYLIKEKVLSGPDPHTVASFLREQPGLCRMQIGQYFGMVSSRLASDTLDEYAKSFNFAVLETFLDCLRAFLAPLRLPGEAKMAEHIMHAFGRQYHAQRPTEFRTEDAPFLLAYALVMLNTDLHQQTEGKKQRMSKADFVRINRGVDGDHDLGSQLLEKMYDDISARELSTDPDNTSAVRDVCSKIQGLASEMAIPSRQYVCEGLITEIEAGPNVQGAHAAKVQTIRNIFLFDDQLIITKPKSGKHVLKRQFNLVDFKLFPVNSLKTSWQICSNIDRSDWLMFSISGTEDEAKRLADLMIQCINDTRKFEEWRLTKLRNVVNVLFGRSTSSSDLSAPENPPVAADAKADDKEVSPTRTGWSRVMPSIKKKKTTDAK